MLEQIIAQTKMINSSGSTFRNAVESIITFTTNGLSSFLSMIPSQHWLLTSDAVTDILYYRKWWLRRKALSIPDHPSSKEDIEEVTQERKRENLGDLSLWSPDIEDEPS